VTACVLVGNSPGKGLIRVFCRISNSINAGNFTECKGPIHISCGIQTAINEPVVSAKRSLRSLLTHVQTVL
jgi:hypothetical protein